MPTIGHTGNSTSLTDVDTSGNVRASQRWVAEEPS